MRHGIPFADGSRVAFPVPLWRCSSASDVAVGCTASDSEEEASRGSSLRRCAAREQASSPRVSLASVKVRNHSRRRRPASGTAVRRTRSRCRRGSLCWKAAWSSCHCFVSRVTVAGDGPAAEPRNCARSATYRWPLRSPGGSRRCLMAPVRRPRQPSSRVVKTTTARERVRVVVTDDQNRRRSSEAHAADDNLGADQALERQTSPACRRVRRPSGDPGCRRQR